MVTSKRTHREADATLPVLGRVRTDAQRGLVKHRGISFMLLPDIDATLRSSPCRVRLIGQWAWEWRIRTKRLVSSDVRTRGRSNGWCRRGRPAVGVAVGAGVGVAVGVAVGVGVGVAVGVAVGAGVGVAVGVAVGAGVGVAVGVAVGAGVGVAVGVAVGAGVGAAVGVAVGAGVGAAVGVAVGSGVGAAVGVAVGSGVGVSIRVAVGSGVGAGLSLQALRTTARARTVRTASQRIRSEDAVISVVFPHVVL